MEQIEINAALEEINKNLNVLNDKITRIFTTIAGDNELFTKGLVHRIDEIEKNVAELSKFKTKLSAAIITAATIGSIIGSIFTTIIKK